jgi:hypothetical protein
LEAILQTTRTGLACRIFKSKNGRYPDDLEALVPAILPELPIDPFTGKPLIYKRNGEGFIAYSIGLNMKDEDGRETWLITEIPIKKDDDWSWKEER